jgi:hypothetical protein
LAVHLEWERSTDPNVAFYVVYFGSFEENIPIPIEVDNVTRATVPLPDPSKTYFFYVIAVTLAGVESDPSNIAVWPTDFGDPGNGPSPSSKVYGEGLERIGKLSWPNLDTVVTLSLSPDQVATLEEETGLPNSAAVSYRLYHGAVDENTTFISELWPGVEVVLDYLQEGRIYFFFATFLDEMGRESEGSNIVLYTHGAEGAVLEEW